MKHGVNIIATALLWALPAFAWAEPWSGHDGAFTIDFAATGWTVLDPAANTDLYDGEVAIAIPMGDTSRENRCSIDVRLMPVATIPDRALLNEGTRRMASGPATQEMLSEPDYRHDRIETPDVDGVTTFDVYGRFMSLDHATRRFWLMGEEGMLWMYTFACSVPAENQQAVAQSHAIISSLRFHLPGTDQ